MLKITFKLTFLIGILSGYFGFAQTLNQSANWPNSSWSISGTYTAGGLLSDPSGSGSTFTFDDDGAGSGSADAVLATSPIIDLTAASNAGETWIAINSEIVYRELSDILAVEVYDADAMSWSVLETFSGNSSNTDFTSCNNTVAYTTAIIDIANYSSSQLAGFQYRFSYDDQDGWSWGFCITSPTITSAAPPACIDPNSLEASSITASGAQIDWVSGGSGEASWEYVVQESGTGMPTSSGTNTSQKPVAISSLMSNTTYEFYVRAACSSTDFSDWVGPFEFRTLCSVFSLPFTETFNSDSATQACWSVEDINDDGDEWDLDYTFSVFEGDQCAIINTDFNSGNNDDYLITPGITLTGNDRLIYQYRVQSSGEPNNFELLLSTTGTAPADFTNTILADTEYSNTTYEEQVVDLSSYSGTVYIAWHIPNGGLDGWRLYIDSVVIEEVPTCEAPLDLTVGNLTTSSAEIGWTSGGSGETEWEYLVQEAGLGAPTASGTSTTVNPAVVSGLSSDTSYEFYVRALCSSSDVTSWSGPFEFNTLCDPFGLPFVETFDSDSTTEDCWTVNNENGDLDTWNLDYIFNAFEGDESANMYTDINNGINDDYLITPGITLTGNDRLVYQHRVQSSGEPNNYELLLSTTGIAPADFTNTLLADTEYSNTTYEEQVVDLSSYSGTVYIAWHIPNGGLDGWRLYIDSVVIEEIPSCEPPMDLTATGITNTTADIGWTSGGSGEAEWEYVVQVSGTGTPTTNGTLTTNNPETITGLLSNTVYEFYVRGACSSTDLSTWAGPFEFNTACDALSMPFTETFNSDSTTQNCWTVVNVNDDADTWNMDYTINPFEGDECANINTDFNNGANDDYLISPGLELTGTQELTFQYRVESNGEPNNFEVLLSTTGTAPADFTTTILADASYDNTTYEEITVDLSAYSGTVYLAWHIPDGGLDGWRLYLDSIVVDEIPGLSLEDFDQETLNLQYYPNPTSDVLNVSSSFIIEELSVINMLGQVMKEVKPENTNHRLDFSNMDAGVYYVKTKIEGGYQLFKIIKK